MSDSSEPVIYQLKVVLLDISPMIWRRLLIKSNSTIEDLHYTLQIAMGWEEIHLHYFVIHGKQYGITLLLTADADVCGAMVSQLSQKNVSKLSQHDSEVLFGCSFVD